MTPTDPTIPLPSGDRIAAELSADGKSKIPVVKTSAKTRAGFGYATGGNGQVNVPDGKRIRTVSALFETAGSVQIQSGDVIPQPAGSSFGEDLGIPSVNGVDVAIVGAATYYVAWED